MCLLGHKNSHFGVWNDILQRPVEISQAVTIPSLSPERAMPSSAYILTNQIGAGVGATDSETAEASICQKLIDLSLDDDMREEENTREVMSLVWPTRVSMG